MRILLVEDEGLLRQLALEDLIEDGHEVTAARDADQALAIIESGRDFDLLFTDIRMPGAVDGWELGRRALARNPALRVLYASGYSDTMPDLSVAEAFLRKPYRHAQVQQVLARLCGSDGAVR